MRLDHNIIAQLVTDQARVLDLGCGDGSLLQLLQQQKSADIMGVEIDHDKFNQCVRKGVSVIEQNLDRGLDNFSSQSFDVVILSQTLQALHRPDLVLQEMLRIGSSGIVAFPNFGHWRSRLHLISQGRMPVSKFMPYDWYNTPNIHFCTVYDFESLCAERGIKILHRELTVGDKRLTGFSKLLPNLFSTTAIYHISR